MKGIDLREIAKEFYIDLIRNPDKKKLKEIFDKIHERYSRESAYRVCFPSTKELLKGEVDDAEYGSSECAGYAQEQIFRAWQEYSDWAWKQAIRATLKAFQLVQNM